VPFSLGWAVARKGESLEQTINRADRRLIVVRARERGEERRRPTAGEFPFARTPGGTRPARRALRPKA
jgi:predicted RNA-binding protein